MPVHRGPLVKHSFQEFAADLRKVSPSLGFESPDYDLTTRDATAVKGIISTHPARVHVVKSLRLPEQNVDQLRQALSLDAAGITVVLALATAGDGIEIGEADHFAKRELLAVARLMRSGLLDDNERRLYLTPRGRAVAADLMAQIEADA
jgi:hypothetical protein